MSFWKYDHEKQSRGEQVDWEMTSEVVFEPHAIAKLQGVCMDGMRAQLDEVFGSNGSDPSRS